MYVIINALQFLVLFYSYWDLNVIHSSKEEHIILFVNINWYEDKIQPVYMCMYVPYLL